MVNGLYLYSAFIDLMVTKALYICLTFTHSYTHSYTDGGDSHCKAPASSSGAVGVRCLFLAQALAIGKHILCSGILCIHSWSKLREILNS